ncbi:MULTISPECIES: hypothetical protein [unclassified Streptomyces]|uniref:Uncharacterized protein n=1 Tax=Streptomyces sp. NBC_00060 TaxID=2975636 RepID=A0AAU2GSL5_9ACTN
MPPPSTRRPLPAACPPPTMILLHTFVYGVIPAYALVLAWSVVKTSPPRAKPQRGDAASFWRVYFTGYATFPLLCLLLIATIPLFPGRVP